MNKKQVAYYCETISKVEAEIRRDSSNLGFKEELAQALSERYIHGEYDTNSRAAEDLERLRSTLKEIPKTLAPFPRAYVAYLDEKDVVAVSWLKKYAAILVKQSGKQQIACDDLY